MRSKQRISNFLNKINWFELIHNQWNIFNDKLITHTCVFKIQKDINIIKEYWLNNPDERIAQVLVNNDYIPNKPGFWYYDEEYEILVNQGIPVEECLYWTSIYDKDMNLLDKPIKRIVSNLTKDHIYAIIKQYDDHNRTLPEHYQQAFDNVLNK